MNLEYRLVRYATNEYDANQVNYGVQQVYVDDSGNPVGRPAGDPALTGNSSDDILALLRKLIDALSKPVVDDANRGDTLVYLYGAPATAAESLSQAEYV